MYDSPVSHFCSHHDFQVERQNFIEMSILRTISQLGYGSPILAAIIGGVVSVR